MSSTLIFMTNTENDLSEDIDVGSFFRLVEAVEFDRGVCKPSRAAIKRKKQRAKLSKLLAHIKPSTQFTTRKYIANVQELESFTDDNVDFDPSLSCPVCLDLFHHPHVIEPCQHVFCEPCLRKLTNHCTTCAQCPLCRCTIQRCILDADLHAQLCLCFSLVYSRRERFERRQKSNRYPLPCEEPKPLKQRLLLNIARFRNDNRLTSNCPRVRVWCLRFTAALCGVFLSGLFVAFSLPVTMATGYRKARWQAQSSNVWILTLTLFFVLTWFSNKVISNVFQLYLRTRTQ